MGSLNFRLRQKIEAYEREDNPSTGAQPIPIKILHCLYATAQGGSPRQQSITDLAWIAFLFLLQPVEYCQGGSVSVSTTFQLWDIQFYVGRIPTPDTTAIPSMCASSYFVNGLKGDSIGNGETGHPRACAVAETRRHVAQLLQNSAGGHKSLAKVHRKNKWSSIQSIDITKALIMAVNIAITQVVFNTEDVSA